MAIRSYRILTPDTRNRSVSGFDGRVQLDPQKKLTSGQHHCGKGRNGRGIITARRGREQIDPSILIGVSPYVDIHLDRIDLDRWIWRHGY